MTGSQFDIPRSSADPPDNRIEKRVWIKASAEVVYRALTHSKELARWFCDRADCNPCEGGEFIAFWKTGKGGQKGRAIFTRVVPNVSLELLWMEDGRDTQPGSPKHTLRYTIKSKSGMTEVVMVDNDDTAPDEETYTFLDRGWNAVLLELKDFCERKERSVKLRSGSKFY
ncbi:MAG: SRPBCC domain-containing protein [Acidobacteria bacterium]|nr:SRPBCC domain-containing protein [Acidobacteriota bacterium]